MNTFSALPLRRQREVMGDRLALAGARILDIGSGDGALARWLAEQGAAQVIGIECTAAQLAKARASETPSTVSYIEGVGQNLPLPDASQDIAILFNSLHHIPASAMAAALGEARRVLVGGGLLYIAEPIAEGPRFELGRLVDDETEIRALAYQALKTAAASDGWMMVEEYLYRYESIIPNFEHFRDTTLRIRPERATILATHEERLRADFQRLGRPHDQGVAFDQPMRVNILKRQG